MPIRRLQLHIPKFKIKSKILSAGLMVFFFVIFDGVLMYLAPIMITSSGISESIMGIIIGSSSIAGMFFDMLLCKTLKITHYRRMFLFMFILALLFPLFLFGGTTITFYFIAMVMWGFYYDFYNIGTIDFVERTANPENHVSNFGMLRSFEGSGYLLAPFLGSILLLFIQPGIKMFLLIIIPLIIAFIFYLTIAVHKTVVKKEYTNVVRKTPISFFSEIGLWKKVWNVLFPILLLTLTINLIDAAIWTFGPIFSEYIGKTNNISGGIFMTAYALPPLLVGWVVGKIAKKFGDTSTAQGAIAIGSFILIFVGFVKSPMFLIIFIFITSFFFAISWPSINAVYTEYIKKITKRRKEIETLQDLFTNIGDASGPIVGGYMAQYLGFEHSFIALGILGIITAMYLHRINPTNETNF